MGVQITKSKPRVRNLPEKEREPFSTWLRGMHRPRIDGVPEEEQDGYYSWDYNLWKYQVSKSKQQVK